ncbi:hypothetical protein TMPK1_40310 [Rhodospirillales bacterium TMPK1]|uniref:Uncharacterized protein n=1 Tax=Roseiterribacter gracilis TaxID=2812848 RepID=A0A8S8XGZ4_9PROT|nr:hypothetical protein TMPK1_40310 [Rhodospirillales bacterium TMPK1]
MLSRALCSFTLVPLPADATRRRDAVRLRARADAPFAEPGFAEDWRSDAVAIWCWDRPRVWRSIEAAGFDPARVRIVPETIVQARAAVDGLRLVAALDGVDAQLWRDGVLVASRWFADVPTQADWLLFQRGASIATLQSTIPQPVAPVWIDRAWLAGPSSFNFTRVAPRQLAAAIALLAALPLGWRAGEAIALNLADARLARAQASEAASLGGLEASRRRALADLDAVQAIAQLDRFPSQLALLAAVTKRLPDDTRLVEWSFQAGDLSFTATADAPIDLPAAVRTLSAAPLLTNLVADRALDGRGIVVRCRVRA